MRWLSGVLLMIAASGVALAGVSDPEWKELSAKFQALWAKGEKVEAVELLGKTDDLRAVQRLYQLLVSYAEKQEVREAIRKALSQTKDEAALDWLAKQVSGPMAPHKRAEVCETLAQTKNAKIAEAIRKLLKSGDPQTRSLAIDALGNMEDKGSLQEIVAALKDKVWQVRASAILALVKLKDKAAVPALIEALEKEPEGTRIRGDVEKALRALTGAKQEGAAAWKSWWKVNESKPLEGQGMESWKGDRLEKGSEGGQDGSVTNIPTYYGIKIFSKRIVFIIDISGSMDEKYDGKKPPKNQVVEISGKGGDEPKKRVTLPWEKIKTKWDLAREQLIFTLNQLDPRTMFNIIHYNHKVTVWKPGLLPATPENVAAAIAMLKSIKPNDQTNIYGALQKGFTFSGPEDPAAVSNYVAGVDTIFFMTDGWPTVGKITFQKPNAKKGEGQIAGWEEKMVEAVKEWNKLRKIKIHTVGIGEHAKQLLQKLAEEFGGEYVVPGDE